MIITIISIILGSLRLYGIKHIAFQAIAHFFSMYLIMTSKSGKIRTYLNNSHTKYITLNFVLIVLLSVLETTCFLNDHGYIHLF
jgi:hypothetical protein